MTRVIPKPKETQRYVFFGCGNIAQLFETRIVEEKINNELYREFVIKPTEMMKYYYQIQDEEYDLQTGTIKTKYPIRLCIVRDLSPLSQKWDILCDFRGKKTEFMEQHFIKPYLETIKGLTRENETFRILLARQTYESKNLIKYPNQIYDEVLNRMKKQAKVIKQAQSTKIETGTEEDNDQEYEEQG